MVLGLLVDLGLLYVGGLYLMPLAVVVLLWNFSFWFGWYFCADFGCC